MSASSSGQGQSGDRPQPPRREARHAPMPEASTDPGRSQPYESLYRGPTDSPNRVHRTTARHYEPSSAPPEEQPPGDTYHWLYRNDAPPAVAPSAGPTDVDAASPARSADSDTDDATRDNAEVGSIDRAVVEHAPLDRAPDEGAPVDRAADPVNLRSTGATATARYRERKPSARRPLVIVLLVVLLVALMVGGVLVVLGRQDPTSGSGPSLGVPSGAASTTGAGPALPGSSRAPGSASAPEPTTEPSGAASPTTASVQATGVRASCQARPSTDGGGRPVSYQPELTVDEDPSTAWRCDGSGKSESLTFSFAAATRISEVGVINGYAKMDPATNSERYDEYRRITEVRWTFPSGTSFTQDLQDGDKSLQKMPIATQSTDRVQLTVTRSTKPGSKARTRDAVLVSEVSFAGPAS